MLEYDRIDISEGIDVDKTDKSKKCKLCRYWYFLNKNFTYGPYLCKCLYRIYFPGMSKHKAKKLMINCNLIDKIKIL